MICRVSYNCYFRLVYSPSVNQSILTTLTWTSSKSPVNLLAGRFLRLKTVGNIYVDV